MAETWSPLHTETTNGGTEIINASGMADEFDSIVRDVDEISARLNAMMQWRTDFEAFVLEATDQGSAFRAAVIRAGTNLAVCQGKTRVLAESLENASAEYREVAKL